MRIKLRIKVLLAERDWTQKYLAEITGLSTRLISDLANNRAKLYSKDALEKIIIAFGITDINELFIIEADDK
ncbi:helix-turn-helix domain-containing protein [Lysinibacillus sp. BSL11]